MANLNLSNTKSPNQISGRIFIGYILDIEDPANLGRKAVNIPALLKSLVIGEKYIFCKEIINTYVRTRDPMNPDHKYLNYGSYQHLLPGTKVLVTFINNSLESGYIIGIDSTVNRPFSASETLIFRTPNKTEMFVDDDSNNLIINNNSTAFQMTKEDIFIQVNDVNPDGQSDNDQIAQTFIQLGKHSIIFKVGKSSYIFGENGITFSVGDKGTSYFELNQDTIKMNANKSLNITSNEGKIHLNSQYTYITGYNELHLFGTDARLTGAQKAQISGNTVALWGWFEARVKGMHVGIDAYINLESMTLIKNETNLALNNIYSTILSNTSSLDISLTGLKSEAYSLKAQDGIILSNIGLGSGISSSITSSMTGVSLSLKLSLMSIGTGLLMNDPFTGVINQFLTKTISGSAHQANSSFLPLGNGLTVLDDKNSLINLLTLREDHDLSTKKYILPDKILSL